MDNKYDFVYYLQIEVSIILAVKHGKKCKEFILAGEIYGNGISFFFIAMHIVNGVNVFLALI